MYVKSQADNILVNLQHFKVVRIVDAQNLPGNVKARFKPVAGRYMLIVTDSTKSSYQLLCEDYITLGEYGDKRTAEAVLEQIYSLICHPNVEVIVMPPRDVEYQDIKMSAELWKSGHTASASIETPDNKNKEETVIC